MDLSGEAESLTTSGDRPPRPAASRADSIALQLILEGWAGRPLPDSQLLTGAAFSFNLARKEHLFLSGDIHPFAYVIRRGLLKVHRVPDDRRDSTYGFRVENDMVASIPALKAASIDRLLALGMIQPGSGLGDAAGGRAVATVTAIEPTELIGIDISVLDDLSRRHHEWSDLVATSLAVQLIQLAARSSLLREHTPEERYRLILDQQPGLTERLPQRELAKYLGITEAAMSRLVKRARTSASTSATPLTQSNVSVHGVNVEQDPSASATGRRRQHPERWLSSVAITSQHHAHPTRDPGASSSQE